MPKATIKSKTGATITIEGSKDEVAKIIADYERMSAVQQVKAVATKQTIKKREEKKRRGASDLVVELREEGFFKKPKALGEISQALEGKGYIYPVTTLSGVVLGLVQKKLIGRKKIDGKWVYGN